MPSLFRTEKNSFSFMLMNPNFLFSLCGVCVSLLLAGNVQAETYEELLDDVFPTSVAPVSLSEADFEVIGAEKLPSGARVSLEAGSIQWSRIENRLVLPRVRVRVELPGVEGGRATAWDRSTPFQREANGTWSGEFLLPLVSGTGSRFMVSWTKPGADSVSQTLTLARRSDRTERFAVDTSCSSSHLSFRARSGANAGRGAWVGADCRWIREKREGRDLAALDLWLFWDGEDDFLRVNGVKVPAVAPSVFRLELRPESAPLIVTTREGETYEITYAVPPEMSLGFVGLGLGPYLYRLSGEGTEVSSTAAVITIYGSYQLGESVRLTAFNATTVHRNFSTDTGLYVKTDSFRFFDQRIAVYLMFGANVVGFNFDSGTRFRGGAPQGFEAVVRDFIKPNHSLTAGAFVYPPIDGKSYYNAWLRFGSPKFFGELNYIAIRNRFDDRPVYTRSAGISVGFPFARLF
jgi:hypothetical protein